jgi:pilus assembly protein CpaF
VLAMNTGHEGCLSTVHANSSEDCLSRLLSMALMSDESVPVTVLESWLASALDVIVHQMKRADGTRTVSEVSVVGSVNGRLTACPVYSLEGGDRVGGLPGWFEEKIGRERAGVFASEQGGPA